MGIRRDAIENYYKINVNEGFTLDNLSETLNVKLYKRYGIEEVEMSMPNLNSNN